MRDLFLNLGVAFVPVTIALTCLWFAARARAERADAALRQIALDASGRVAQPTDLPDVSRALDAIALEVERIAEGQRFTTKVLAERRDVAAPGRHVPLP